MENVTATNEKENDMKGSTGLAKDQIEERIRVIEDRMYREFRPTESAYWRGRIDRHEYIDRVFGMLVRVREALVKDGLAIESNDDEPLWACALRIVAITFAELPRLENPEAGYRENEREYRIVKTKKCVPQKNLVHELVAHVMYYYGGWA